MHRIFCCLLFIGGLVASFQAQAQDSGQDRGYYYTGYYDAHGGRRIPQPESRLKIGTIKGHVQYLMMRRHFDNGPGAEFDASSGTIGLKLDYHSGVIANMSVGLQLVTVQTLWDGGSTAHPMGAAWQLSNDDLTELNLAFLQYDFHEHGLADTTLRVGRVPLDLTLTPKYEIRQKQQAWEAVVFHTGAWEDVTLDIGHLERYSSWSSRDGVLAGPWNSAFIDVEDAVGASTGDGMQFIELGFKCPWTGTDVKVWDLYGSDLLNTAGVRAAYQMQMGGGTTLTPAGMFSHQTDVGDLQVAGTSVDIDAQVYEVSAKLAGKSWSVEPGWFAVAGNAADRDYQVPFRSQYAVDPFLLWNNRVFQGGSNSYFFRSRYAMGSGTTLVGNYVVTQTRESIDGGATDQEVNLVIAQALPYNLSLALKGGYGTQDVDGGADRTSSDLRMFLTWSF